MRADRPPHTSAATLRLTEEVAEGLEPDVIDDLAAGQTLDSDMQAGRSLHDAAVAAGYADPAARILVDRYRTFLDEQAHRDQLPLF
ncbi:hypothetical protein E5720_17505 [Rhodococcus sp. PAMC28707]|uniref:hypothetical protein n=1 Tax=unclassified Rhodococcus (in: high G+C Gram-positive bacteria) TaxID=192944 RepID=UPI00109D9475|nr:MULTISPECIES: hypothetical protein [unclassified Rhodococcus (in: high G+C Gram-positive bacteria)]QCB51816.1 hypothetical protein E5769_18015 [Rhodococcus sp. PAMC28705]QCB60015.1 hypothetical protein E5720_17505 [Rhodococcus sp. PAMC28707]